jgi:hypothetical protein
VSTGRATAAVIALGGLATLWAWLALAARPGADERREPLPDAARPFVEVRAAQDLAVRKRALLASYGWVDREKRIVRIPIERAFEIAVERAAKAAKEREEEAKDEKKEPGK